MLTAVLDSVGVSSSITGSSLSAKAIKPQPGELMQSPYLVVCDVIHVTQHACFVTVARGHPSAVIPPPVLSRPQEQSSQDPQGYTVHRLLWENLLELMYSNFTSAPECLCVWMGGPTRACSQLSCCKDIVTTLCNIY